MQIKQSTDNQGQSRYLTTAIPYVNASPHIGFALEVVQADTLARFYRQKGNDVRLQAGTDENSIKNVQAAEMAGLSTPKLVERNAAQFLALKESLNLSYDDFIRTSIHKHHKDGATRFWNKCFARGDIYKRPYRGLYCSGCEQFYKPEDLDEGRCPEHLTEPELVEEENWFFRLSRYQDALHELYSNNTIEIVPDTRRNEVLSWVNNGLEDFSISRSATRARGWGIPVPGDPEQVIYVWFDALCNYITALGYHSDDDEFSQWWTKSAAREHVVGKGITRFHAVYWPAMLLSAELPLPTRILVHGYVTAEGRKIGKSLGNAVDPIPLAQELGTDALRFFLLKHIRSTEDGDYSRQRFHQAYNSELVGQLGNLVHRVLRMIEQYFDGVVPVPPENFTKGDSLIRSAEQLPDVVASHLSQFAFDRALNAIWVFISDSNRYVNEQAPWELAKAKLSNNMKATEEADAQLRGVLYCLSVSLHTIAYCLAPALPETSRMLFEKLCADPDSVENSTWKPQRVRSSTPLFERSREYD